MHGDPHGGGSLPGSLGLGKELCWGQGALIQSLPSHLLGFGLGGGGVSGFQVLTGRRDSAHASLQDPHL